MSGQSTWVLQVASWVFFNNRVFRVIILFPVDAKLLILQD